MKKFVLVCVLAFSASSVNATALYNDFTTFNGMLGTSVTDDYENPAYNNFNTDVEMSSVLGETSYQATGFANFNLVADDRLGSGHHYCAGCNGSFLLDFSSTSVGSASGVFGVGFDVISQQLVFGTTAFVTFGDGSTSNYALDTALDYVGEEDYFWGITSEFSISSIHFGLIDGGTNTDESVQVMALDNLTIGSIASVPEPSMLALLFIGLIGLGFVSKRRN